MIIEQSTRSRPRTYTRVAHLYDAIHDRLIGTTAWISMPLEQLPGDSARVKQQRVHAEMQRRKLVVDTRTDNTSFSVRIRPAAPALELEMTEVSHG